MRTIRERLLAFFESQAPNGQSFTIPYSREELASYLYVDRSALSSELSKLQREGAIQLDKNRCLVVGVGR